MTRFLDGPAKGQVLMLKRAPVYLRVIVVPRLDALDQLEDSPEPNEQMVAYQLACPPWSAFIDGTNCRGLYPISKYQLCTQQPPDATMRSSSAWAKWTEEQGMPENLKL